MRKPNLWIYILTISCFIFFNFSHSAVTINESRSVNYIDVGVILDLDNWYGKMSKTCISLAVTDFYNLYPSYSTRLVLHTRNSNDSVEAASAAFDLLKNVEVKAIIGPQTSGETEFVIDLGDKAQVPVISFSATSPSLSVGENRFLVQAAGNDSAQTRAISAIVKAYGWRETVLIYQDNEFGRGIVPYLVDELNNVGSHVSYRSLISSSATDDQIENELYKLMTMQTRVFIVHMLGSLGHRLFMKANEIGMMSKGYAWIVTDGITNVLESMNASVIESMQGILGVKAYFPSSKKLNEFKVKWKRNFQNEYPDVETIDLSIFGLRAYDAVWALAMAVERGKIVNSSFEKNPNSTKTFSNLGLFRSGKKLLQEISGTQFKGVTGDFRLKNLQLELLTFEIITVIGKGERRIGFWTSKAGITRHLISVNDVSSYSTIKDNLGPVIWPGESSEQPRGWEIPLKGKKLKIAIPIKYGFKEFLDINRDPKTKAIDPEGFTIDVFNAVLKSLPYGLAYEFVPIEIGAAVGSYDQLVQQVALQHYDAVVGDMTIVSTRATSVDFTLPFTESGISLIVPIHRSQKKSMWVFLKPWTKELWVMSGAGFVFIGFIVWVLEHRINEDFRGPRNYQIGSVLWFAFSTLVFAHRAKVESNLARFVVIVWLFVVLILTSSYTASLTSILTVEQLKPTVTDIEQIRINGEYIGYQDGSFVFSVLKKLKFDEKKMIAYNTVEEFAEALSKGSGNGGVSGIFDEIPYIRVFLKKYCNKFVMVGPTYRTGGLGFVFQMGSPLAPDFSRAILNVTQVDKMNQIENKWFGSNSDCSAEKTISSQSLSVDSVWGLFVIVGIACGSAFLIFWGSFLYKNRGIFSNDENASMENVLRRIFSLYNKPDFSAHTMRKREETDKRRGEVTPGTQEDEHAPGIEVYTPRSESLRSGRNSEENGGYLSESYSPVALETPALGRKELQDVHHPHL